MQVAAQFHEVIITVGEFVELTTHLAGDRKFTVFAVTLQKKTRQSASICKLIIYTCWNYNTVIKHYRVHIVLHYAHILSDWHSRRPAFVWELWLSAQCTGISVYVIIPCAWFQLHLSTSWANEGKTIEAEVGVHTYVRIYSTIHFVPFIVIAKPLLDMPLFACLYVFGVCGGIIK